MRASERESIETSDELMKVFRDGSIFDASDENLRRYLKHLCSEYVPNEMVRHREMNRCLVINTLQTRRFIESVERKNNLFTVLNLVLTVATVSLAVFSILQSNRSTNQVERLITTQEQRAAETQQLLEAHLREERQALENILKQQTAMLGQLRQSAPKSAVSKQRQQ